MQLLAVVHLDDFHHEEVVLEGRLKEGRVYRGLLHPHARSLLLVVYVNHSVPVQLVPHQHADPDARRLEVPVLEQPEVLLAAQPQSLDLLAGEIVLLGLELTLKILANLQGIHEVRVVIFCLRDYGPSRAQIDGYLLVVVGDLAELPVANLYADYFVLAVGLVRFGAAGEPVPRLQVAGLELWTVQAGQLGLGFDGMVNLGVESLEDSFIGFMALRGIG